MLYTLCYNIPSYKVDMESMNLLESFVDEWLDRSCLEPYVFKITDRFYTDEIRLDIHFQSKEDAFFIRIKDIPEQLPAFKSISEAL